MIATNRTQLLREEAIEPTDAVLEKVLGNEIVSVYRKVWLMMTTELGMNPAWRYYKDGNAWLCKVEYKKKTVFWLSVWQGFIKTCFYFTEKTSAGIFELSIDESIKIAFDNGKPIGKLLPLTLDIDREEQLNDLRKLIRYKLSLK